MKAIKISIFVKALETGISCRSWKH